MIAGSAVNLKSRRARCREIIEHAAPNRRRFSRNMELPGDVRAGIVLVVQRELVDDSVVILVQLTQLRWGRQIALPIPLRLCFRVRENQIVNCDVRLLKVPGQYGARNREKGGSK